MASPCKPGSTQHPCTQTDGGSSSSMTGSTTPFNSLYMLISLEALEWPES